MSKSIILPREVDSKVFANLADENEENVIILQLQSYGGMGAFRYHGRRTRSYVFRYNRNIGCHTLRIPQSVAMANDAEILKDIFDQKPMPVPVVPTVELWNQAAAPGHKGPARNPHSQVPKQLEKKAEVQPDTPEAQPDQPAAPDEAPAAPHISVSASPLEILGLSKPKKAKRKRAKRSDAGKKRGKP